MPHLESFLRNPLAFVARAVKKMTIERWRYTTKEGYNAEQYWGDRFRKYGLSLLGPGHDGYTAEQNSDAYSKAGEIFQQLCREERIPFRKTRVLEVGCATGFYAAIFKDAGVTEYLGIDITDALFGELRGRFKKFRFVRLDVGSEALPKEKKFGLATLIDVAQHIVARGKFEFAVRNIDRSLRRGGRFIFTADVKRISSVHAFYETQWVVDDFRGLLPGYVFGAPRPFRDKFIVCATKK